MATVVVRGWREGFRKVACTDLLRAQASLQLADAKACTDRILEGKRVELLIGDPHVALLLAEALDELGADVTVNDREADV